MLQVILVVAYMVMTHLAVVLHSDRLALGATTLLVLIALSGALRRRRPWAYLAVAGTAAAALTLASAPWARILLFVPPIAVNLGLAWLFGHTLVSGRMPLVERIIRLLHVRDDIKDPAVWSYARIVTGCWTVLFIVNATLCAALALVAAPGGLLATLGIPAPFTIPTLYWSLFSDAGCYVLTGIMFVGEYQVRRRRFPWQPYRNFFDFLRQASAIGPALFTQLSRRPDSR